jgi:hypothetical protein
MHGARRPRCMRCAGPGVRSGGLPQGAGGKDQVNEHLVAKGHAIVDVGTTGKDNEVNDCTVAARAAERIQAGNAKRGVLRRSRAWPLYR